MKKVVSVFAAVLLAAAVIAPAFGQQETTKGTEVQKPKGTEGPDIRKVEPKGTEGPDIRKVEPKGTEGPDIRKK